MTKLALALTAIAFATPAFASAPGAWSQLDRRVDRACAMASGLQRTTVSTDQASFDDRVPVELRVVEGYNRGGVVDVRLCAYDRRTRRVALVDGVGRLGVNRR